ncbi:hypothetical protein AAE478_001957 [Parahypoxylon ruwenzoriense]
MDSITLTGTGLDKSQEALLEQMWEAALKEYENARGPSRKNRRESPTTSLEAYSLSSLEMWLEKHNENFKEFRAHRHKLIGSMKGALRPIQIIGNIASGGVSTVFSPAASIFSAVTFLVEAAENVSKKYEMIVAMFEDMQRFTVHLEILLQKETVAPQLRETLVKTMGTILKFIGLVEKAMKDGRVVTFLKRASASDDPVQQCRDELNSNVQQVQRVVGSLSYVEAALRHKDEQIVKDFQEKKRKWKVLEHQLDANLSMPDVLDGLNRAKLEDTCKWIRKEPSFKRWMSGSVPVLWVSGGQGTGKTHVAADLMQFLKTEPEEDLNQEAASIDVVFYFCGKTPTGFDSSKRILDTLSWQLACNNSSFFDQAVAVYDAPGNSLSSTELWRRLLRNHLDSGTRNQTVFIIDGLDELDEIELDNLLRHLGWLCNELSQRRSASPQTDSGRIPLKVVALGRASLEERLDEHFELEIVEVLRDKSEEDLQVYIRDSISRSRELQGPAISDGLREAIIETLENGAGGSFLWVNLKVKELSRQSQVSQIKAILETPPAKLGEQLISTLRSFSDRENNAEVLNTILAFTTWFERPMYLSELAAVPKLESPEHGDDDGFIGLDDLLMVRYSPLFRLQRDDGLTTESLRRLPASSDLSWIDESEDFLLGGNGEANSLRVPGQHRLSNRRRSPSPSPRRLASKPQATTVSFDHVSFHEYFRSVDRIDASGVVLDRNLANFRIARVCLILLTDDKTFGQFGQEHSLTKHAALNFSLYIQRIQRAELPKDAQNDISGLLSRLFGHRPVTRRWIRVLAGLPGEMHLSRMLHERKLNEGSLATCSSWLESTEDSSEDNTNLRHETSALMPAYIAWLNHFLAKLGLLDRKSPVVHTGKAGWILENLAYAISDEWLSSHEWVDETIAPTKLHALFLCAFIAKTQNPLLTEAAFNEDYLPMAPANIKEAASWYLWLHYSNTATWHTCIALTYYGLGYRWSTIRECEQAVALDMSAWHALYLLSLSHLELKHKELALSFAEKCLSCWPPDLKWTKLHYRVLRHLAECRQTDGDAQGSHEVLATVLEQRPTDIYALKAYLEFTDEQHRENSRDLVLIGKSICALHASKSSKLGCSKMSELLLDDIVYEGSLQEVIARSLRALGKLPLCVEIYVRAIEAAEQSQRAQYVAAIEIDLADVLFEIKRNLAHPIKCLEQALNIHRLGLLNSTSTDDTNDLSLDQQQVRYRGIASLTRYISARLLKAIGIGDRATQNASYNVLSQLWDLAKNVNKYIPIWLWLQRHCWYHFGLAAWQLRDKETWQTFHNAGLRTVVRMLAGRRGRSQRGLPFRRLAYLSQIRGRPEDVLAALAVRTLVESRLVAYKEVGEPIGFYDWVCDGPCTDKNVPWRTGAGLYHCQLCLDTDWCGECKAKLAGNEIPYTLCSADHPFLHLKPFQKPERGFIMRGSRMVKISDWIDEIADECGLPQRGMRERVDIDSLFE